jgi:hypothetical protein
MEPICKECKYYKPIRFWGLLSYFNFFDFLEPRCSHPNLSKGKDFKFGQNLVSGKLESKEEYSTTFSYPITLCSVNRNCERYPYTFDNGDKFDTSKYFCTQDGVWFEPRKTFWMKEQKE